MLLLGVFSYTAALIGDHVWGQHRHVQMMIVILTISSRTATNIKNLERLLSRKAGLQLLDRFQDEMKRYLIFEFEYLEPLMLNLCILVVEPGDLRGVCHC